MLSWTPYGQDRHLIELYRISIREAVHSNFFEIFRQSPGTTGQLPLRDHEEQHSARHKPAAGVPQKDNFHAQVVGLADFKIVRRVEIEKRQAIHPALDLQGVSL